MAGNGWPHESCDIEAELAKHFAGSETSEFYKKLEELEKEVKRGTGGGGGGGMSWNQFVVKLVVLIAVVLAMGFLGYKKLDDQLNEAIKEHSPWNKDKPVYENRLTNVEELSRDNRAEIRENAKEIRENSETLRRVEKTTDRILERMENRGQ